MLLANSAIKYSFHAFISHLSLKGFANLVSLGSNYFYLRGGERLHQLDVKHVGFQGWCGTVGYRVSTSSQAALQFTLLGTDTDCGKCAWFLGGDVNNPPLSQTREPSVTAAPLISTAVSPGFSFSYSYSYSYSLSFYCSSSNGKSSFSSRLTLFD